MKNNQEVGFAKFFYNILTPTLSEVKSLNDAFFIIQKEFVFKEYVKIEMIPLYEDVLHRDDLILADIVGV